MRLIFGLVLIVGVGLAGFSVYMAKDYINAYQAELSRERALRANQVPLVEVFVVNRQLKYGEELMPEDVRPVRWPENAIPEGAFQAAEVLFPEDNRRKRTVLRTIEKDEALLAVKLTEPGEDAGVSSRLAKGMRAFAIRVDVASGVSGFLRPGDKVDVYWSGKSGASDVTKLIEVGVRLIAIDQTADEDRNSPTIARTVTVEATPRQVAALAQAQATGQLTLSLVGAEDENVANAVEIDQNQLLGIKPSEVVEVEKEKVCTVRTRRGAEVVEIPIPCATN